MLRIKLWHRVFAVTALATLLAVVTMVLVQQHMFRRGLLDYVNQLDRARALSLVPGFAAEYQALGSWQRLRRNPLLFRQLLGEGRGFDRPPRDQPPRDRPPRDRPPRPFFAPPEHVGDRPPARRPPDPAGRPPRGNADPTERRVALYDALGTAVVGPPQPWKDGVAFAINVSGQRVGNLVFQPLPKLESRFDLDFARSQWRSSLATALAVLALATLLSLVFARRLVAPLRWMADRATHIASGDYTARVASARSDEIGELGRDFDAMAEALMRNREARQRWTAEISHELRTPIAVIRAELDALEDGIRPFDSAALRSLSGEAQRLTRLVEDLYQLSLADTGALAYRFVDEDLAALLREALDAQSAAFRKAQLSLSCDCPSSAPVRADAGRVRQLFANLIANSCRYSDAGGRVQVSMRAQARLWLIDWEDSAPSVPDEALSRLFDPLYRVEASRDRATGGAGLGLAIARRISDAHGATMIATASPLGGLRIHLTWPMA